MQSQKRVSLVELWRKVARLTRRDRYEHDLAEEMRLHLELRAEELSEAGLSPEDAARAARIQFGNPRRLAEESRDVWSFVRLETWLQDFAYGTRLLWRDRAWALVAIATLGLGMSGTVAIFTFVNAFLLRPLPFPEPDRLLHVWGADVRTMDGGARLSVPDFLDLRRESAAFEDLAGFNYTEEELTGSGEPERVFAGRVTAGAFRLLGVEPHLGRGFAPGADRPGAPREIVLSDAFWKNRFGGDPHVLGRTLGLNGEAHAVVGVMPADFVFPLPVTQLWAPRVLDPAADDRDRPYLQVFGRLKPGVTPEQASSDLNGIAARLRQAYPAIHPHFGIRLVPLRDALNFARDILPGMAAALGASALFVLVIVCANVANLMLARGVVRTREMAVRAALGAGRPRLVRQLITESAVLGLLGGAAAVPLAAWALAALSTQIPPDLYRVGPLAIDRAALGFAVLISLVAVAFFGIGPALRTTRASAGTSGIETAARTGRAVRGYRSVRLLVVGQVAASTALLSAAALMMTSVREFRNVPLGFEPRGVMTAKLILPRHRYPSAEPVASFHERLVERAAALPGVAAAATVDYLPLNHEYPIIEVLRPGAGTVGDGLRAGRVTASPAYFAVMGIPLLEGRAFAQRDSTAASPVVVISRSLADALGGQDLTGTQLRLARQGQPIDSFTIVGVAADTRYERLREAPAYQVYFPQAQQPSRYFRLLVRAPGNAGSQAASIRAAVRAEDPQLPVTELRALDAVVEEFLAPEVSITGALSLQSLLALLLALLGVYGVLAFSVAVRAREIGVRLALGATRLEIVRLIGGQAMRLGAPGIVLGLAASYALARLLAGFLYGVGPGNPLVFSSVAGVVLAGVAAAGFLPARRASRVDPAAALRAE